MREPESFDAFYARTASKVTGQMHELAAGDPQVDHAIREAYARAYQQWFEVSGYRDTEAWVLDAAREAYERRRAQPASAEPPKAPDSGTWPGMYRPRVPQPPADPEATIAAEAAARRAAMGSGSAKSHQAASYQSEPFQAHGRQAAAVLAGTGGADAPGAPPAAAGLLGPPSPGAATADRHAMPGRAGGRALIAIAATIVLLAAGIGYLAFGRGHSGPAPKSAQVNKGVHGKPAASMLAAGRVGTRSGVPWPGVGLGWVLVQFSTAQPGTSSGGNTTTFLVDPKGGRYRMYQWPARTNPVLVAWSADAKNAIFATSSGYSMLTLASGILAPLPLPTGVAVAGFTRPSGENIVSVRQGPGTYKLQRYDLTGAYKATLSHLAHRRNESPWTGSCQFPNCGAISSPDGQTAVWGISGAEMQLVSNVGGLIRKLHVPQSGSPPSCTPISWWNAQAVLADCAAVSGQLTQLRLWLVPVDGSTPTPLTAASGGGSGAGVLTGAWHSGSDVYVTATTSSQCPASPSGPGGLRIMRLNPGGSPVPIKVSGSTNNYSDVVGSVGSRLLVLAQTSCPGTTSLLWLNPSSGSTQLLFTAPADKAGVTSATAFGSDLAAMAG